MATVKPQPPRRFIHRALKLFVTASGFFVYPMSRNDIVLVISQKKNIQDILSDDMSPNIAERNRKSMDWKNQGLFSTSVW